MDTNNQTGKVGNPKSRGRGCLTWIGRFLILTVGLIIAGVIYEHFAEISDAKAFPPPGKLVDVGGYNLHINCIGSGSPTVVIDAGMNEISTEWAWVQPGVAKTTQVCTYDRAGSGWSDPGPLPRNAEQYSKELHTLVKNAGITGPYVLVGHSYGGLTMRVYAGMFPSDVAGVVLIESMVPEQFTQPSTTSSPQTDSHSHKFTILPALARIGLVRLLARPLGLVPHLPPEAEKAYLARLVLPYHLQTISDDALGVPTSGAQAKAVKTLDDLPLIVLTAKLKSSYPDWQTWQTGLLQLSSNSQQLIAENSGHNIELEQPDAAIAAIVKMVELVRQATK